MLSTRDRRLNILLIIFSGIGILALLVRSIYLVASAILSFDPGFVEAMATSLVTCLSMLFCASALLPTLVLSLKALKGQAIHPAVIPPIKPRQLGSVPNGA